MQHDNKNKGVLFRNANKGKESDRDFGGEANVQGADFWVSGWLRTSKNGLKYLALSLKPKAEPTKENEIRPASPRDFDDEIPF